MKIKAMKWLTTAPVAIALAVSLAACGSGSAQPSGTPTDALAGSDQQTLDKYTTADVTPIDKIDKTKLGLITEGTLRVGTLSDAPPNIFIDPSGKFTGYDNELLRAIGDKLGLKVEFASTDFSALLSQVANKQFDVGSSSISTTDARRETVGFTNGYDFGYMAVVTKNDARLPASPTSRGVRIGVVQGTVQDDYVTNTLKLEPVRFPDYNTVYGNVKNGQIDAWVAPRSRPPARSRKATAPRSPRRLSTPRTSPPTQWPRTTSPSSTRSTPGWTQSSLTAPGPSSPPSGTRTARRWLSRPRGLEAGQQGRPGPRQVTRTFHGYPEQLADTFLDWEAMAEVIPKMFAVGLPNTLVLAVISGIIGTLLGMALALMGISRNAAARWIARIYTDVFRGLPACADHPGHRIRFWAHHPRTDRFHQPVPHGHCRSDADVGSLHREIFRSGIQSVDKGQLEASRALGFGYGASMRLVVVPQGIRRVLPAW
jgi:polar amino acid transport system substrate-binding protein